MKLGRNTIFAAGLFTVMLAGATPTLAGFSFKSSPAPTPSAAPAPDDSFPAPVAFSSPSYPSSTTAQGAVISWDAGAPPMSAQRVPRIESAPLSPYARRSASSASAPGIVSGFGSDMPLQVALQQVVPQQYKVSLAPGVDSGVHVSWQGDRAWEQVLLDMLSPVHLSFVTQGNTLVVRRAGGNASIAHAHAPSRKTDMIPDDMMADTTGEALAPPQQLHFVPPAAPVPMAQPKRVALPVQETDVASLPTPVPFAPPSKKKTAAIPPMMPAPLPLSAPESIPTPLVSQHVAAAPAVSDRIPAPAAPEQAWSARKGQTLRAVLGDWSKAAHVKLYWSTDYDYKLNGDIAYTGSFDEAVGRLFDQFSSVKPQPYGELHRNPQTGGILVVNTYGTYN